MMYIHVGDNVASRHQAGSNARPDNINPIPTPPMHRRGRVLLLGMVAMLSVTAQPPLIMTELCLVQPGGAALPCLRQVI